MSLSIKAISKSPLTKTSQIINPPNEEIYELIFDGEIRGQTLAIGAANVYKKLLAYLPEKEAIMITQKPSGIKNAHKFFKKVDGKILLQGSRGGWNRFSLHPNDALEVSSDGKLILRRNIC